MPASVNDAPETRKALRLLNKPVKRPGRPLSLGAAGRLALWWENPPPGLRTHSPGRSFLQQIPRKLRPFERLRLVNLFIAERPPPPSVPTRCIDQAGNLNP